MWGRQGGGARMLVLMSGVFRAATAEDTSPQPPPQEGGRGAVFQLTAGPLNPPKGEVYHPLLSTIEAM
ncbi:hypothetical protein D0T66_15325 [Dysgonomonas sp. 25]|nr:hypothetical protein [Dysgonomonas sp. 25]